MSQTIKIKRGAQSAFEAGSLQLGELGFTTDLKRLYIGNGIGSTLLSTSWSLVGNDLQYDSGNVMSTVAPTAGSHLTNKTYVDGLIAAAYSKIEQGNTKIQVVDTGTGTINVSADGSLVSTINVSGLALASGSRVNEFSIDGTLAGNSDTALPTEKAVKTYVDTHVNKTQHGRASISSAATTKSVTFGTAYADTNYTLNVSLTNTTDATASQYAYTTTAKSTTGFTVKFSGEMDSANYVLEWRSEHD